MTTPFSNPLQTADASSRWCVRATVAPLLGEARISGAMTSQLISGAVLTMLERQGDWLRVRGDDGYEGWTHIGFLAPSDGSEPTWRMSLGCTIRESNGVVRSLPLGARITPSSEVMSGDAIDASEQATRFPHDATAIAQSAATLYSGASYLWGGVTTNGCDCSGFVQQIFGLHGIALPRDAWQQAQLGAALVGAPRASDAGAQHAPADLLYFSDRDDQRITHVGIALGDGRMVHSALRRGGISIEQMDAADDYVARLRAQCVGVQRVVS